MRDRRIIYVAVFLRALSIGMTAVLLGLYLSKLRLSTLESGAIVGAGLAGAALMSLYVTFRGDRLDRRQVLPGLSLLGAMGIAGVAIGEAPVVLAVAAFMGMVNGMGRDRGAVLILEQAVLPGTTTDAERTRVFAVYNVLQDAGHALGALAAGAPSLLHKFKGWPEMEGLRGGLIVSALLLFVAGLGYLRLSPALAAPRPPGEPLRVSPESRRVLWKISTLFAMDSLGGGFLTGTLLTYFFCERFGVGGAAVAMLFFGARVMNALSHLGAAWLAKRIGLVNTMVFTHIPSSLLLASVAFTGEFWLAATLFLLREGLVEMDVPTRQSYVMALVRPEERTFASGVTHLVRMGSWAVAPTLAGWFMGALTQAAPLFFGAGLKIVYDVLLYVSFRKIKPPEEKSGRS